MTGAAWARGPPAAAHAKTTLAIASAGRACSRAARMIRSAAWKARFIRLDSSHSTIEPDLSERGTLLPHNGLRHSCRRGLRPVMNALPPHQTPHRLLRLPQPPDAPLVSAPPPDA